MIYDKLHQIKKEIANYKPYQQFLVKELEDWFNIEFTYASNALEGNTLNRHETSMVVQKGSAVGGKSVKEHLEAKNHNEAILWINSLFGTSKKSFAEIHIMQLHSMISKGIDDINGGNYRTVDLKHPNPTIHFPCPSEIPELMKKFMDWFRSADMDPIEFAALGHLKLISIHPFINNNMRVARLLMNLILTINDFPPVIIRPVDKLIYKNTIEKALIEDSQNNYFDFISAALEKSLNIYLKTITGQQKESLNEKSKLLKIGELAKLAKESIPTIRFWTKEGLIEVEEVTPSGYQLFNPQMRERIEKIQELKQERFTIREIKDRKLA